MTQDAGKVFLVGSGPGNAAYLTVWAQQLLETADVLVYDALVDRELLHLVPDTCLTLDVGKRGGQPSMPQVEINRLLVQYCQQGRRVIRLKSGDPFIFSRSLAEIQALTEAACAFDIVPGVSSALVAPLLARIPLTDPVLSRCFAVLSAHDPDALDWQALARLDTLVILMGGQHLADIVEQLQMQGRSHQTPIAIIRWAGQPDQEIWEGTLADIVRTVAAATLSPCVMVIGEVVRLRTYIHCQSTPVESAVSSTSSLPMTPSQPAPLADKTVLVTRSASQSGQFRIALQQIGAIVLEMPTLEIVPPSSWQDLDAAIARLADFDWLILTSANSVEFFLERLAIQLQDIRALSELKIAVVGEKTAATLKNRGLKPDFIPPQFVADSLVAHFPVPLSGTTILFPRVETGGRDVLVKELTQQGAQVTEVAAYQSRCPDAIAPDVFNALQQRQVDVVTFASSKTVKHFCQLVQQAQGDDSWHSWLEGVCLASIGPQTSKTCLELLGRVDVEAQEYTLDGLIHAIAHWFAHPRDRAPD